MVVPGVAVDLLPLGIGGDLGAEVGFLGLLLGQDGRVGQSFSAAQVDLQAVLQAEDGAAYQARLFRPLRGKGLGGGDAALQILGHGRTTHVALHQQLGHRVVALSRAGMAGDEDQLARRGALGAPLEIVIGVQRLAVLVDAEEGHVQVVARIGEVIRVAAEEGCLLLGRKDQAHVGVGLVGGRASTRRPDRRRPRRSAGRSCPCSPFRWRQSRRRGP